MQLKYAAAGLMAIIGLAGCQRTSYDYNNSRYSSYTGYRPFQPQPVPSVQAEPLPPPGGAPGGVNMAAAAPDTALDVVKETMVGSWRVANGGVNCDMFLTLTNLGAGSRGGTRGCAGELTSMGSWEVSGKMVLFKNRSGDVIGWVYKSTEARFDGTTNSGQPLTLSRSCPFSYGRYNIADRVL